MKTLENHTARPNRTLENFTIIYDSDCPLCMAYTNAFITTKMLDKDGRVPYQQVGGSFSPELDAERAKNEIALIDRATGKVRYGLDSLIHILGYRHPWMGKIVGFLPINILVRGLYSLISYNRKVIIPAVKTNKSLYECVPSFNFNYRVTYIVLTWFLTSITLVKYSSFLTGFIPETNLTREFLICGGQVVFQSIAVGLLFVLRTAVPPLEVRRRVKGEELSEYLGNMMTVSLFGAILLLPAIIIGSIFPEIPEIGFMIYFAVVVAIMLYEHARRMKILELGWWPSVSWVLYRIIVLGLVLI